MSSNLQWVIRCDGCDIAYDPINKTANSIEQRKESKYNLEWQRYGVKDYCKHCSNPTIKPKGEQ